jgi:hypothetical protein
MKRFCRVVEILAFAMAVVMVSAMLGVVAALELVLVRSWIYGGNGWYPLGVGVLFLCEVWIVVTIGSDEW